jgi:sigma-E factor negative regulatory protein RseA
LQQAAEEQKARGRERLQEMKTGFDLSSKQSPLSEQLSALADGELQEREWAGWTALAREPDLLAQWASYQRIGDSLRAGAALSGQGDELAFVDRFRQRLAREGAAIDAPPELASPALSRAAALHPVPQRPAANDSVYRWKMVAGLAGVMAVLVVGWAALEEPGQAPAVSSAAQELAQQQAATASERVAAQGQSWQPSRSAVPSAVALLPQGGLSRVSQPGLSLERSPMVMPDSPYALQAVAENGGSSMIRDPRLDQFLAAHRNSSASTLQAPADLVRDAVLETAP